MAEGDWARASLITEAVRVGAIEQAMSPGIAVYTVPVLVASRSEMPNLVTSIAACLGLKVLGAGGVDVPSVAAHGAEVVHVDDWGGSRTRGGVLELRRAGDEVDEHIRGRRVNCGQVVGG